jgi:hypothetical protein
LKPSDSGTWIFTSQSRGNIDFDDDINTFEYNGKLIDAKRHAIKWAKDNNHYTIYIA